MTGDTAKICRILQPYASKGYSTLMKVNDLEQITRDEVYALLVTLSIYHYWEAFGDTESRDIFFNNLNYDNIVQIVLPNLHVHYNEADAGKTIRDFLLEEQKTMTEDFAESKVNAILKILLPEDKDDSWGGVSYGEWSKAKDTLKSMGNHAQDYSILVGKFIAYFPQYEDDFKDLRDEASQMALTTCIQLRQIDDKGFL